MIRAFASGDVPHIVRGTGAVYVRSSKGKEPVDDHRTLLELARRGEEAEARGRSRLVELSAVGYALGRPTGARRVSYLPARSTYATSRGPPRSPPHRHSPNGR